MRSWVSNSHKGTGSHFLPVTTGQCVSDQGSMAPHGTASEHMIAVFLFAPYIISFCSASLTAPTANGAMLKQQ